MATVIEFYVPQNFKQTTRWVPPDQRGKVVEFPTPLGEEVSVNYSGVRNEVCGSQAGRGAAC